MASAMQIAFISFVSLMVFQTMGDRDGSQRCTERGGNCADSDSADVLLTRGIKMHSGSLAVSESCDDIDGVCWVSDGPSLMLSPPVMFQTGCEGTAVGPVNVAALPKDLLAVLNNQKPPKGVPFKISGNTISAVTPEPFESRSIATGSISGSSGSYKIEWDNNVNYTQQQAPFDLSGKKWTVSGQTFLNDGADPIMTQNDCGGMVSVKKEKINTDALPPLLEYLLATYHTDNSPVKVPFRISDRMVFVFFLNDQIANGTVEESAESITIQWGHGATWKGV